MLPCAERYAPERTGGSPDAERERERLSGALAEADCHLARLIRTAEPVGAEILECQRLMLADGDWLQALSDALRQGQMTAEAAVRTVCGRYAARFSESENPALRRRAADLSDLGGRLERILTHRAPPGVPELDRPSVLVGGELTPSQAAQLDHALVRGVLLEQGGPTAHSVLMLRAMGIPCVLGLTGLLNAVRAGVTLALDGHTGDVAVNPSQAELRRYRQSAHRAETKRARRKPSHPGVTADGVTVGVLANISSAEEAERAADAGCDGVGLFRTELLYLSCAAAPDEDAQTAAYTGALSALGGRRLVIRTLDIGGDKEIPYLEPSGAASRGLRYCLERPALFKTQLRAVLRTAQAGPVSLLFPMVGSLEELRRAKALLAEAGGELRAARENPPEIPVGMMAETAAAVEQADSFAREVDFFSVGTNDLAQALFAAVRGQVSETASPFRPDLLCAAARLCECAARNGIAAGLCGQAGEEPLLIPLWIAMGMSWLSVSVPALTAVRETVRRTDKGRAQALLESVLRAQTAGEVKALLRRHVKTDTLNKRESP
jgi:phosphoenolpyruvate-protein phosphotransferase